MSLINFWIEDALIWNCVQLEKLRPRITLCFEIFVQKIRTNFNKHFQEVRRFEEKMCYAQIFGA